MSLVAPVGFEIPFVLGIEAEQEGFWWVFFCLFLFGWFLGFFFYLFCFGLGFFPQ